MKRLIGVFCLGIFLFAGQAGHAGEVTHGLLSATQVGQDRGFSISGEATMVRISNGTMATTLYASGLAPNTLYHGHVHVLTCAEGAGGHYKNDPNVAGAVEENEIWLDIQTNGSGRGIAVTKSPFYARPEARSIIIHDADKAKIACADLN
jgi:hypothetical protein